ncbi:MAG: ArgE/DapE family deacylase [Armatimonadota bacterium]|nr:ArgE/DapE family deacylase [Armatimonadota bacterium]MDW8024862.1 ArgE/DapE family deacylase [Armatimonadota bacterium]
MHFVPPNVDEMGWLKELCESLDKLIESRREEAIVWLTELISLKSIQGEETEMQIRVMELMEHIGLNPKPSNIPNDIIYDPEYSHSDDEKPYDGRFNIVAKVAGQGGGRSLIVQTHSDVIPEGVWKEAFKPRYDGQRVYGRGAVDAKGQIVMMLLAVRALEELGIKLCGDLELQVVIEEEVGGNGALALIRQGCKADGAVILESTNFNVYCANRGALWFRIRTFGKSVHMGRRHEGVNAIEKMVEVIKRLLEYEGRLIEESRGYPLFEDYEHPVQLCIGIIRGGTWPSMVPDECVIEGGVGFLPNKTIELVKAELRQAILSSDDEWLREHFELTFPKLHNDAYEIPPQHSLPTTFHRAASAFGLPSKVTGWNISCDARLYAKLAGIPTIVFGAGEASMAHSACESIAVSEILNGAKVLALGIILWCGV